jgi:hypothetical protein
MADFFDFFFIEQLPNRLRMLSQAQQNDRGPLYAGIGGEIAV